MSFEEKIPTHIEELESRVNEIRAKQHDMETPALTALYEELEEAEQEVQRIDEEIDEERESIEASPEWVALNDEARAAGNEISRLKAYSHAINRSTK